MMHCSWIFPLSSPLHPLHINSHFFPLILNHRMQQRINGQLPFHGFALWFFILILIHPLWLPSQPAQMWSVFLTQSGRRREGGREREKESNNHQLLQSQGLSACERLHMRLWLEPDGSARPTTLTPVSDVETSGQRNKTTISSPYSLHMNLPPLTDSSSLPLCYL